MTITVKEFDGARSMELEVKDDIVFLDDGRFCLHFDRSVLLRAVERELGVTLCSFRREDAPRPLETPSPA